jgi:hypothetical protein
LARQLPGYIATIDQDKCAEYVDMILNENDEAQKPTDALSSTPAKRKLLEVERQ